MLMFSHCDTLKGYYYVYRHGVTLARHSNKTKIQLYLYADIYKHKKNNIGNYLLNLFASPN